MNITGLGRLVSLETPVATLLALSVFCASTLAQSVNVASETGSILPDAGSVAQVRSAESFDLQESALTSDEVERSSTSEVIQRRLRLFGASTNGAPRHTRSDLEVATWRNLPDLQAAGDYRAEVSEITSRWWFSTGRTDLGFGVGSVALMARPIQGASLDDAATAGIALASSPALSVGIRRRTSSVSTVYADATRSRNIGLNGIDSYSGKVGVEWKSAESRWSVAYSGLGLRLSSESRMTVNLRRGGLGIYMRSQF